MELFRLNWVRLTSLISRYQEHEQSRDPPLGLARLFNFLAYRIIDGFSSSTTSFPPRFRFGVIPI